GRDAGFGVHAAAGRDTAGGPAARDGGNAAWPRPAWDRRGPGCAHDGWPGRSSGLRPRDRGPTLRRLRQRCSELVSSIDGKLDPLRQRQLAAVVDRARLPAHVAFPGVGARLTSAASGLLSAEGAADLRTRRANVDVGDPAVRPDS